MNFTIDDKLLIKKSIEDNIEFLRQKYSLSNEDYALAYNNIEKIYDYAIKKNPDIKCHDLLMLYIAHETFDILKQATIQIQEKKPNKKYQIYITPLTVEDVEIYYSVMFEGGTEDESGTGN